MPLQEKLDAFGDASKKRQPPEVVETMRRATANLVASGQAGRTLKAGAAPILGSSPREHGKTITACGDDE